MSKTRAVFYALLAAALYAVNVPLSKLLLEHVGPTMMASLLYLGAGLGIALLSLGARERGERLSRQDLPYVLGMIVLDVAAPIFLMLGVRRGTAANASLLGNFEIVATTVVALCLFREAVTKRLWAATGLITVSSILLSFEGADSLRFSVGSLLVLLAAVCWGFENNCTRSISGKSTYEIVTVKGLCCALGSFGIARLCGEPLPALRYALCALLLGFAAYGLSIFLYVRAQSRLGAAKTSAYYAVAPFIGAFLSFVLLRERLTGLYLLSLGIMLAGTALVVVDTMARDHAHPHRHTFTHTHDGSTHRHTVVHTHEHRHLVTEGTHAHHHSLEELEHDSGHGPEGNRTDKPF